MKLKGNLESNNNNIQYLSYLSDSGTANAYAVTCVPAISSYVPGLQISFKATNTNTSTSTLNVNAKGAKTIKKNVSLDLAANDIIANQIVTVVYDGYNNEGVNRFIGDIRQIRVRNTILTDKEISYIINKSEDFRPTIISF